MKSEKSKTLRKKALEASSILTAVVESSDDAIIVKTLDGTILRWNRGAQNIYGYIENEVRGCSISILVPPDKTDEVQSLLQRIRQGQHIEHYETVSIRKDGGQIDVSLNVSPIKDSTGKILGALSIVQDITERRRAQEAIHESEERYRMLVESASDIIATVSPDGIIISLNPAFERITGWACEEWLGKSFQPLIHPDDLPAATEVFQYTMRGETMPGSELRLFTSSGGYAYVEYMTTPLMKDGKVIGNLNIVRDITERKRNQEAVHRAHNELEIRVKERTEEIKQANLKIANILESISDGFMSLDTEWRFTYVNHRAANNVGFTPEELIGQNIWEKFPEIIGTSHEVNYRKAMDGRVDVLFEVKSVLTDKTDRWYEIRVYPSSEGIAIYWLDITERKRIEEALHESEQKFMKLFQGNAAAIALTRLRDRCIIEVNERWQEVFGFSREDVIGGIVNKIKLWKHPEEQMRAIHDLETHGGFRNKECEFLRKNGDVWTGLMSSEIIQLQGERFILTSLVDITERKLAEEALKESEERLRFALETSHIGAWDLNLVDHTAHRSLEHDHIFGYEQLLPQWTYEIFLDHVLPEDRAKVDAKFHEATAARSDWSFECRIRRADSEVRWIWAAGRHQEDATGSARRMAGIIQDITERKRAEETLRKAHDELELKVQERTAELEEANIELKAKIEEQEKSEEKIREQAALLDKAHDAIDLRDLEHRIAYWNKGAEYLYGWTIEEVVGKNADELLYKDKEKTQQLDEAKKSVVEKGEWTGELYQVTKDGRELIVESRWTLVHDNEGKPKSILIINTDITEKKKLQSHLLRAQRMESIGTLAGGIAHDLNNMLTPMMMSLHMLKEKLKDEQSQKLLTILEKNSERSADLIKQVLSFSRGVEGEHNPIRVKHIITEIEMVTKETFPRNIEIRTDIPEDLFTISGDATQFHQVMMNLCVNARDAMPDGGILDITASNFFIDENYVQMHTEAKVGSYVAISVSDTGIGIPPKIVDRIFEPFFTTKEFGKGTGLGLSTAHAVVKSHGGFINVYSEVGKGTTFRVYLPATSAEMQKGEEEQPGLFAGQGELILVAEDEDSVREVTISTLEKHGYNVLAASDGADAVALYAQNKDKIKVVLMDMMMPVMDGEASIRTIRKINPEVKVVVVSGLAEKDKLAKIESTRAQALLPKPYTAQELLKTIYEVLSTKETDSMLEGAKYQHADA